MICTLPTVLVGGVALLHSTAYLHGEARKRAGWFYFHFLGTLAAMLGVVLVPTASWAGSLAFLLCWEAMGLFSSGLVGFESAARETKKAAWIYLLACQAGALCLILGFFGQSPSGILLSLFIFIGFAMKIGFPPFHVWLPEAHPAAPAPASALMSGAMIPLGFYGILKFIYLPLSDSGASLQPLAWTLLICGALAALGGILFALPQHNLKKLLAFSSVENMGVIALGFSLWLMMKGLPDSAGLGLAASLAFYGALLHIVNHALLKGALFLGAGSVLRMTGTLDIDRLGGLMKRMPVTGTLFTINAFGLSGLPPLNGFMSEALIYAAAFIGLSSGQAGGVLTLPCVAVILVLALTGGLATAVYTKAVSATFLGEPRSDLSGVTETPKRMWIAIGALTVLSAVLSGTIVFLVPVALVWLVRRLLPRGAVKPRQPTWDCGFAEPTARMAWTGTAFSQPLADNFKAVLRPRVHVHEEKPGIVPGDAAIAIETDDPGIARLFGPLFHITARLFQRGHLMQSGSLHFYVLLMILAVIALLVWGALS